jgi:hypothetical protein
LTPPKCPFFNPGSKIDKNCRFFIFSGIIEILENQ